MSAKEHQHLTVGNLTRIPINVIDRHETVVALLPGHQFMGMAIYHHIFIFYRQQPPLGIDAQHPFAIARILHRQITAGVPRANGRMGTTDSHDLS